MFLENLGKRSIASDIAAACVVIQKHTVLGHQGKRISSWMSKQPVFCSIPKRLDDGHQYPVVPWRTRGLQTVREFSRKSPDSLGAKLLTASTASWACRNRQLGTLMLRGHHVEKCVDPISYECIEFHGLSQVIASLSRENFAEREAVIGNLPWTQTEKDNVLAKAQAWTRARQPMLCLHATDEDGHPFKNEDESGKRLCDYGVRFSKHAPRVRDITNSKISCGMFRKLLDVRWNIDSKLI